MSALALKNEPEAAATRFLHLTDLHFWRVVLNPMLLLNKRILGNANLALRRRRELLIDQATAVLDYTASLGVRDVVLTGDFSCTAVAPEFEMARDFLREMEKRGMTPRVIPGNHDVYTYESVRQSRFERFLGDWLPAAQLPAVAPLSTGARVLYVPSVCPNLLSSKGRIRNEEIEGVRALLGSPSAPKLVAGHYPVLERSYAYSTTPGRRLRNAAMLAGVMRSHDRPLLYFCGHVHRFSLVQDPVAKSLTHLTSGALFRRDHASGHTAEFSEVSLRGDAFQVRRHRRAGIWRVSDEAPRASTG